MKVTEPRTEEGGGPKNDNSLAGMEQFRFVVLVAVRKKEDARGWKRAEA